MFRLPVSGLHVEIRPPSGIDDLLLHESATLGTELALALIHRLVHPVGQPAVDWSGLSVTDIETLLLLIRHGVIGDLVEADMACAISECGARVTISFRISQYLAHHRPRALRQLEAAAEPGWFQLGGEPVKFRLPRAADQVVVAGASRPHRELMLRCLQPVKVSAGVQRRVLAAMQALAPALSGELRGNCPECGHVLPVYFDVQDFVLRELRGRAASVYEDVHLLAFHYKWTEESILRLPRNRRRIYVETLHQQGGVA